MARFRYACGDDPIIVALRNARQAQKIEELLLGVGRPAYHFEGRTLQWGKDIPASYMRAMLEDSEVFTLSDTESGSDRLILRDAYGNIREFALSASG